MRSLLPLLFLLSACTRTEQVPDGLLDRDRFKETLLQAQLVEARMNQELVVDRAPMIPADRYYAELFAQQGTTKEQFERTFEYYTERPDELRGIYEEIFTELSRRKDEIPH
ncbi:MAG: DUF4296 domain-containing protein [Flavobacteriales bacterium]|nr:DUF4296 domain-containing protein [Flavobacteriales bacterium]